jgi:hypothetical protein
MRQSGQQHKFKTFIFFKGTLSIEAVSNIVLHVIPESLQNREFLCWLSSFTLTLVVRNIRENEEKGEDSRDRKTERTGGAKT